MRIIIENAEQYLHDMATALHKDSTSMKTWLCMHISQTGKQPALWSHRLLNAIKQDYQDLDCDLIYDKNYDICLFCKDHDDIRVLALFDQLTKSAEYFPKSRLDVVWYDMHLDSRELYRLFNAKSDAVKACGRPAGDYDFGEIDSLNYVFAEAKMLRKAREPLHILIVEDDPLTRRMVCNALSHDYALITATTAHEAVANYMTYAPDIVFLDIRLPDINGFNVLHCIIDQDPDAYVVMFSGNSYIDNVTHALCTGASGFVAKPFRKERIQHYINDGALRHRKAV